MQSTGNIVPILEASTLDKLKQECKRHGIARCDSGTKKELVSAVECALRSPPGIKEACKTFGVSIRNVGEEDLARTCCSSFIGKKVTKKPSGTTPPPKGRAIMAVDLQQVASDFDKFWPDGFSPDFKEEYTVASIGGPSPSCVTREFRHLGEWINDQEDYADYLSECESENEQLVDEGEEEEDCQSEDEYFDDNDNRIWAEGEHDRYVKDFTDWASKYPWFNGVEIDIDAGEKDWAEYSICKKTVT